MVLIYTNESNPSTLKLIIAANLAKEKVDLKVVNVHDNSIPQPKHLPYLKINEEQIFFSANSGVCYFLPTTNDNYTDVIDLLEWEAKNVSPELAHVLGASTRNDKVKASLVSSLNFLNEHLQNKNFLVGDGITAADVVIWSTIYPLSACPKNSTEYLSSFTNITNWIQRLGSKQEFEKALSSFKLDISTSYSALLTGAKYLSISDDNQKDKHEKEHIYEAITAEELEFAKTSWKKDIKQQPQLKKLQAPVLPVPGERNVFVTSALPYVNNVPHLGNIIGCVLSADVFVRYSRLCNNNTIYMGGTDEYGTATEAKALEEGISCQEICDKYYKIHKDIYDWFNISFDHFGRTSAPYQTDICQEMFITLNNNGFTFTESIEQLHCEKCNKFLADRFVEGGCPHPGCHYEDARGDQCDSCGKLVNAIDLINPKCKVCSSSPQVKKSNQFFIDLPKLEPLIHHWLKIRCTGWSHNAQVIAKAWLKEGLRPRCITRDLKWGVPVPLDGFRNKVFYVWFDAVMGYLSISKAYTRDYMKWWKPGKDTSVTLYQFMAKDNVPFHAILFPAMLLGANEGYITVNHLMATEYLNYEDGKFSKSRGVGVFGTDARSTGIPSDIWRFYLLYVRPESQDSSFSWADFATKHNSELLNNLGNFINRALVFAKNNYNKTLPEMKLSEEDYNLLALCTRELKSYTDSLERAKLRDGIRHILAISRHGNQYMQSNQPWVLLKGTDEEKLRAGTVIGVCCNLACLIATLLQPYMPDTSDNLTKQLNTTRIVINPKNCEIVTMLPAGHKLGEPSPLFTKIELATVEELKQKFAGKQETNGSNGDAPAPKAQPTQKIQLSPEELKKLEEEIVKQGLVVRQLKESGAAKPVWVPEVDKLLDLKNQLSLAIGVSATGKGKKGKK